MPNYGIYNKIMSRWLTVDEMNDQAQEGAIEAQVRSLELLPPGALLEEGLLVRNRWNLGSGIYGAFEHDAAHNAIRGVVAGAGFTKRCKINGHASVFGVEFSDLDDLAATELVLVGESVAVSFINCIFRREASSVGGMVRIEEASDVLASADAQAVFIGCIFINGGTTTINNVGGSAAKVQVIGCINDTPNAGLGTVTEIGTVDA